jgi:hypothetical protein
VSRYTNNKTNEVRYSDRSWAYLQVIFVSLFSLTKFLNMKMVRNFEVMLGQNSVQFCNSVHCHTFVNYLTCY